ncbi:MAG: glycerol-3-phosphate dehydrogenase subunit GlpB [Anaerolineae bacterium]|nr:glycerol-3-phosphate dehydrogenase subunit GlpB [Anaerolineae bacterium]MDW8100191.1 glycerol-3-phosphate dehydrogenase subunit GlpB [Anaerolineae bacterium]
MHYDVIVIGAGLAGLVAATVSAQKGVRVLLLAKGIGCTHLASGCVDVLGRLGDEDASCPRSALSAFLAEHPEHVYARVGIALLDEALSYFQHQCEQTGWPYSGSLDANWWLPTAAGVPRPTCLIPESMIAGDVRRSDPMLLVGFRPLRDFYPQYAAANLQRSCGLDARGVYLDVPALRERDDITPAELARAFDEPSFRSQVARALKPMLGDAGRVGFPAVLGLSDPNAWRELSAEIGRPVFEVPTLPPSVPGMRLFEAWRGLFRQAGGRLQLGFPVVDAEIEDKRVRAVLTESAARPVRFAAKRFVLATGGLYGHGLEMDHTGYICEPIFHLPLRNLPARGEWTAPIPRGPHPILSVGVAVDELLRPIDEQGRPVFENLHIAGALLADGVEPHRGIGDGVAIATGYMAASLVYELIKRS